LYLNFASERIEEAFALVESGKTDQMIVALQGYDENIRSAETILKEDIAGGEGYLQLAEVLDETLEIQTEKLQRLLAVAPAKVQSLIQAAIMKISTFRFAMTLPSPEATATHGADETPISPVPSETKIGTAAVVPSITPTADGTPIPSSTPVPSSTPRPPTATATPPVAASQTPSPTYPPPTNTPIPTFTHTHTPSPSPTSTPSNTPIPGPDLIVSAYQWDSSLPPGSTEILDYLVRNIGTTTAQGGYLIQLYVDEIPLQNIDPEIGVREGRQLLAGETDIDYFLWTTTCGVHSLEIVVDDTNIIPEINEANNISDDYTITVDCPTATPP
jgi:hypothetical protein